MSPQSRHRTTPGSSPGQALFAAPALALALMAAPGGEGHAAQCGMAAWYQHTGRTASGEPANPNGMTAAHPSLPFGTRVTVTNLRNGRSVTVRINDRGPFGGGRIIDVTRGAARRLGMIGSGVARVRITGAGGGGGGGCR